jgi:TRAP-type C4-dicarboxylate transport system substrate-binding protein
MITAKWMKTLDPMPMLALVAGLVLIPAPTAAAADSVELVFASAIPAQMGSGKAVEYFAKRVEELSKGAAREKLHMGGTLHSEVDAVQAMKNGEIALATISEGNIAGFSKDLAFLKMPYVFRSPQAMVKFLQEDPYMAEVRKKLESQGMLVLAFLENGGFRVITESKRQVRVPADLAKITLRTTQSPVDVALIGAFGANPTPIAWSETYNAVSQGVVDGVYIPYAWNGTGRIFEVAKYVTEVDANLSVQTIFIDPKRFAALAPAVQQALRTAGREAEDQALKNNVAEIEFWKQQGVKNGVKIYSPSAAELEQWRKAGQSIWPKYSADVPKTLLDRIVASQK